MSLNRELRFPSWLSRERVLLALVLLFLLVGLKLVFTPGLGHRSLDGNFYYQIARHVAEGDGLQTSVSLYFQGLKELPHKTNQNPVWPLILGHAGRLLGLWEASIVLPKLFYVLTLVLIYFVANRVAVEVSGAESGALVLEGGASLDYGHLAVLLFGLNPIFFRFTSLPYTEGLAFTLFFGAVLAAARAIATRGAVAGAVAGALAMLAFMTRSQFLGAPMAVLLALALCTLRDRRAFRTLVAASLAAAGFLGAWISFLWSWVKPFRPRVLIGLTAYRETPELLPFRMNVVTESALELWMNRLFGLLTAFDPRDENSYLQSFGGVALAVPLVILVVVVARPSIRGWFERLVTVDRPATWLLVLGGASMLVPLHKMHFTFFKEWLFGFRHGLPLIFLVVVALPVLLRSAHRPVRWLTTGLVFSSLLTGTTGVATLLSTDFRPGLSQPEQDLVRWLDRGAENPKVVVTSRAQTLGAFSTAGFQWIRCEEPSFQTRTLLAETSAEFVVAYPGERHCPFLEDLLPSLEVVTTFGSGPATVEVLRPRWSQ